MRHKMLYIFEFFLAKRLHIGFLAFLMSIFYMRSIGVETYSPLVPWISFFIVWAAYNENLTTDRKEDQVSKAPHGFSSVLEAHLYPLEKFYPIFYLLAIVLSWLVSFKCFIFSLCTIVIFASYVHRWLPLGKKRRIRLKEIFIVKNIIPPLGWLFSVWILPFVTSASKFLPEYGLLLIVCFLWFFREEIKFDIPDSASDQEAGIKTFPNTLGEQHTKTILAVLNYFLVILFLVTLLVMNKNHRGSPLDCLLANMFPFLMAYFYDHEFSDLLFKEKKKEYCNIGVLWWDILMVLYLALPYPINIFVFLFFRLAGKFLLRWPKLLIL